MTLFFLYYPLLVYIESIPSRARSLNISLRGNFPKSLVQELVDRRRASFPISLSVGNNALSLITDGSSIAITSL